MSKKRRNVKTRDSQSRARALPRLGSDGLHAVGEAKDIDRRPLSGTHRRLAHYRDTFPDDPNLDNLYVTVCLVQRFRNGYSSKMARTLYARLRVYTQWLEATLSWEYTKKWGRPPALHYKKSAYKRD